MRKISNPHLPVIKAFIFAAVILQIVSIGGWVFGSALIGGVAGIFEFGLVIVVVIMLVKGQNDLQKIYRLVASDNLLAHWVYPEHLWNSYAEQEYKRQISNGRITMVVFFIAGPFVGFFMGGSDGIPVGIGLGIGLGLFSMLIGYSIAKDVRRRITSPMPEAFISSHSVFINGTFADWNDAGNSFSSASIIPEEKNGSLTLLIKYSMRGRHGIQEKEVFIPIPDGKISDAEKVVAELTLRSNK